MHRKVTFPILRALMSRYGMNYSSLGEVIPNLKTGKPLAYQTVSTKMNKTYAFDIREMTLIRDFFNELLRKDKEKEKTAEEIFFNWVDSNEVKWKLKSSQKGV